MKENKRYLIVSDSYKGSISSSEINKTIAKALSDRYVNLNYTCIDIADGGEGTLEVIKQYVDNDEITLRVMNPLMKQIDAKVIVCGDTAYIEMAQASGLTLIEYGPHNAMITSSYGTGELIRKSLDRGCRKIYLTIGGSAVNDCGIGAMQALGAVFLGENQCRLEPIGANLRNIHSIDLSNIDSRLEETCIYILCDVDNPITGCNGTSHVFAKQKGANEADIDILEEGMVNIVSILEDMSNKKIIGVKKLGAAGGIPAIFYSLCNAQLLSGIDTLMRIAKLEEKIKKCDIVISGEGRLDNQSLEGKVISGILNLVKKYNKKLYVVAGSVELDKEELDKLGIAKTSSLIDVTGSLELAMKYPKKYAYAATLRLFNC